MADLKPEWLEGNPRNCWDILNPIEQLIYAVSLDILSEDGEGLHGIDENAEGIAAVRAAWYIVLHVEGWKHDPRLG